jgi:hypothetical protein
MGREKASKRGRWIAIPLAGVIGFLLGDWHALTSRAIDLSASQNVALRFPAAKADAVLADAGANVPSAASAMMLGNAQLALLSPEPMMPAPPRLPPAAAETTAPEQRASASAPETIAAPRLMPPMAPSSKGDVKPTAALPPRSELKSAADVASRANRPGFLLNDAQIASIKTRLHLTPDQERMWPAVEAALRNIAYAKTRYAHQRPPGNSAEFASLDPESAAVQGLKSAAVPLIMSFSDEQKNEVRSLAHVMGLDKLASEF